MVTSWNPALFSAKQNAEFEQFMHDTLQEEIKVEFETVYKQLADEAGMSVEEYKSKQRDITLEALTKLYAQNDNAN